ncbi:MAG: EAL domain-containing protein [Gammaproteobacteria bacterium]|nr:EAL domain-containing protein [Gammaproteobacteria bacterium]
MSARGFKYETRLSLYLGAIVLLISLIPMGIIYFVVSHNATETLVETLSNGLKDKSILISRNIDRFYAQRLVDIREISKADILETDDLESINKYIAEIFTENHYINNIEITTLEGVVLAHSSSEEEIGRNVLDFYPDLKQLLPLARRSQPGDVFFSNLTEIDDGSLGVVLLTTVTNESDQAPLKLLLLETNLNAASEIMGDLSSNNENIQHHAYIVNNDGKVIATTNSHVKVTDTFPDLATAPELLAKFSAQESVGSIIYRGMNGSKVMAGFADMAEFGANQALDWSVITIAPFEQITEPAVNLKIRFGIAIILIGSIVFVVMFLISRKIMRIIWSQANYDPLTNLPNRRLFTDQLRHNIRLSKRSGLTFALLFIDLDRFKEVNDNLGHHIGDLLLKDVTKRITSCVREVDVIARIGGDEFALILSGVKDAHFVDRISADIIKQLSEAFLVNGEAIYISASIGITLCPEDSDIAQNLLKNADQAMYRSKELGRSCFSYFTPAMQDLSQKRHQIVNDLREAITESQFELHYQPVIDVASGSIIKAEALIRWRHPRDGLISPLQFIPVAEETNLITEIGDWVFQEATRQAQRWQQSYHPHFMISINVSPVQFKSKELTKDWLIHLAQINLSGESVVIEITEGILMENDPGINNQLLQFRDAGIQVAIDDFGTGYSALSYLKKFDIDFLKIDKSFVDGIVHNPSDFALVEAIIVMSHKLGLKVIAEGIETEQQFSLLSSIDCDFCQGYYFSRPLPQDEFDRLLSRQLSADPSPENSSDA